MQKLCQLWRLQFCREIWQIVIIINLSDPISQCLSKLYLRRLLSLMSCAPPWMTEDRRLWCPGLVNMTGRRAPSQQLSDFVKEICLMSFRQRESLDYFLASVINNKADKSQCLPSCKLIRKIQVYQRPFTLNML